MDVNTTWSCVESHKILLELTDSANGALQDLLDEHSLLWMNHLIIALFEFSKNLDIFNVETRQVMEHIINRPGGDILHTLLIELGRKILYLNLFLEVVHGICQLQIVCYVRHLILFITSQI